MNSLDPISGVDINLYARLCALMKDTNYDEAREIAIANENGVSAEAWLAAKKGWTERMSHGAAGQMEVAQAFMPVYQATLEELSGGVAPLTLEQFARITQECGMETDASGQKLAVQTILDRYELSLNDWAAANSYWTPRVNDSSQPDLRRRWAELVQSEADRIKGIDRSPGDRAQSAPAAHQQSPASAAGDTHSSGFWGLLKSLF